MICDIWNKSEFQNRYCFNASHVILILSMKIKLWSLETFRNFFMAFCGCMQIVLSPHRSMIHESAMILLNWSIFLRHSHSKRVASIFRYFQTQSTSKPPMTTSIMLSDINSPPASARLLSRLSTQFNIVVIRLHFSAKRTLNSNKKDERRKKSSPMTKTRAILRSHDSRMSRFHSNLFGFLIPSKTVLWSIQGFSAPQLYTFWHAVEREVSRPEKKNQIQWNFTKLLHK